MAKNGRPSKYTIDVADEICTRLIGGESMIAICKSAHLPSRDTVMRWCEADEAFAARCARARVLQADYMDDLVLEVANNCTPETAHADKVKISAYQWRAAKLQPKRYGDKLNLDAGENITSLIVQWGNAKLAIDATDNNDPILPSPPI